MGVVRSRGEIPRGALPAVAYWPEVESAVSKSDARVLLGVLTIPNSLSPPAEIRPQQFQMEAWTYTRGDLAKAPYGTRLDIVCGAPG